MGANGEADILDSGKFGIDTNGKLMICGDCCPSACDYCEGITPAAFELTFAGVTVCSCYSDYVTGKKWELPASSLEATLNGSHVLSQHPVNYCSWLLYIEPFTIYKHVSSGCSDGSPTPVSVRLIITLDRGSGKFNASARLINQNDLFPPFNTSSFFLTDFDEGYTDNCTDPLTTSNQYTLTNCAQISSGKAGHGGSVYISPS